MALVAMLEVPVVPIVVPLVDVAHVADRIRMQTSQSLLYLLILLPKDLTCSDGIDKQFADDGKIGGTAITGCAVIALICLILVLGRCAGSRDKFTWLLGIVDEPVQTELCSTFHERIGCLP